MSKELDGRIALAKKWYDLRPTLGVTGHADLTGIPPGELRTYVPRWSSDLNLMWRLEEELNKEQQMEYLKQFGIGCWVYIHATADQKATAWLEVMGG